VDHDPAIDQGAQDLFDEKGVTLPALENPRPERFRQVFHAQKVAHQLPTLGLGEGLQPQVAVPVRVLPGRGLADLPAAVRSLRAQDADQQQRQTLGQRHQVL
jgi:hypothetical protein